MARAHLLIDEGGSIRFSSGNFKLRKDVKNFHMRIFVQREVRNKRRELQERRRQLIEHFRRFEKRKARIVSSPFVDALAKP
jgi:hypothetical protein